MVDDSSVEAKEAKHGNKMIEVKVRFWTNDLAPQSDKILPGHAWTAGIVRLKPNTSHGIDPKAPVPFNSLMELPFAIEKLFVQNGITLHVGARMRKYLKE